MTPQERFICRSTDGVGVQQMMGQAGRYLEIIRAVVPDFVTVMMALAPRSWAVVTVAWEMALVTFGASCRSRAANRFL